MIPIDVVDDSDSEGPESVSLTLLPGAYSVGAYDVASITITDNDPVVPEMGHPEVVS